MFIERIGSHLEFSISPGWTGLPWTGVIGPSSCSVSYSSFSLCVNPRSLSQVYWNERPESYRPPGSRVPNAVGVYSHASPLLLSITVVVVFKSHRVSLPFLYLSLLFYATLVDSIYPSFSTLIFLLLFPHSSGRGSAVSVRLITAQNSFSFGSVLFNLRLCAFARATVVCGVGHCDATRIQVDAFCMETVNSFRLDSHFDTHKRKHWRWVGSLIPRFSPPPSISSFPIVPPFLWCELYHQNNRRQQQR